MSHKFRHLSPSSLNCKVYIGNLTDDPPRKNELEYAFSYYGKLKTIWIARSPPGFGYVIYEDEKDAKDAVKGLDGKSIDGRRIKVELARENANNKKKNYYESSRYRRYRSRSRSRHRHRSYTRSRSRSRSRRSYSRSTKSRSRSNDSIKRERMSKSNSRSRSPSERRYSRSNSRSYSENDSSGSERRNYKNSRKSNTSKPKESPNKSGKKLAPPQKLSHSNHPKFKTLHPKFRSQYQRALPKNYDLLNKNYPLKPDQIKNNTKPESETDSDSDQSTSKRYGDLKCRNIRIIRPVETDSE